MVTIDTQRQAQWLTSHGMPVTLASAELPSWSTCRGKQLDGVSAAQSFAIARAFVHILCEDDPGSCLIVVHEHGVWTSSENLSLYYIWRSSHGTMSLLDEQGGHLFLGFERNDLINLVHMAILFGWGVSAYNATASIAFKINHDGNVTFFVRDGQRIGMIPDVLQES
mgnify:CR=1 FL=1